MAEIEHDKFTYGFVEGQASIELAELVYVESNLHRCLFHFANKTVLSAYQKLDDIEALIADARLLRIHKSYLVNMDFCAKVSNYQLWLRSGQSFSVPRIRYHYVKECFLKHQLQKQTTRYPHANTIL